VTADIALRNVDTVFFLQGAQAGSYLAGVNQELAHAPAPLSSVESWIGSKVYSSMGLDVSRPAVTDLAPQSLWYDSVNAAAVPANIHYYNMYADFQFTLHAQFLLWSTSWGPLHMGDLVMKPGDDNPNAEPFAGGAKFLPGGTDTADRYEWGIVRPYDIYVTVGGGGAVAGPTGLLNDPATHFNFGANLGNSQVAVTNCQDGPSGTQPSTYTPLDMMMAVLQDPANGCVQR
jgi:hypothetical protein